MGENPENRQLSGKAAQRAALQTEINALAKSAYRAYKTTSAKSAFNELLDKLSPYTRPTFRNSFGIRERDLQEELFQEIALRFIRYVEAYNEAYPFLPWWHRIVRNVAFDFLSKRAKQLRHEISIDDERSLETSPGGRQPAFQDKRLTLELALEKLSKDDRYIAYLYFAENFTANEISDIVQKPASSVKRSIHRIRNQLRRLLEPSFAASQTPITPNPKEYSRHVAER